MFNSLGISASALTMQRLRMDVIASNIANADTTRAKQVNGKWQPYQRRVVNVKPIPAGSFHSQLQSALDSTGQGVEVSSITADKTPFKKVYNPSSPDADAKGYVLMPNVDIQKEMVDLIDASRSYEANVTVMNSEKSMIMKALQIGN